MRAIDADALKEKAWDADTRCGYVQVVDVGDIDDAPTIDPVRKGGWVHGKLIYSDISIATCTICGKRVPVGNFCKNCGSYNDAKMEEGEHDG